MQGSKYVTTFVPFKHWTPQMFMSQFLSHFIPRLTTKVVYVNINLTLELSMTVLLLTTYNQNEVFRSYS